MHNLIKCPPVGIISRQEQKVKITKATTDEIFASCRCKICKNNGRPANCPISDGDSAVVHMTRAGDWLEFTLDEKEGLQ